VLQCAAVCCSVLQCVTSENRWPSANVRCVQACCSTLLCVAAVADIKKALVLSERTCVCVCNIVAVCCSMLEYVAVCCSVLQCVTSEERRPSAKVRVNECVNIAAVCFSMLQHVAVWCSVL